MLWVGNLELPGSQVNTIPLCTQTCKLSFSTPVASSNICFFHSLGGCYASLLPGLLAPNLSSTWVPEDSFQHPCNPIPLLSTTLLWFPIAPVAWVLLSSSATHSRVRYICHLCSSYCEMPQSLDSRPQHTLFPRATMSFSQLWRTLCVPWVSAQKIPLLGSMLGLSRLSDGAPICSVLPLMWHMPPCLVNVCVSV